VAVECKNEENGVDEIVSELRRLREKGWIVRRKREEGSDRVASEEEGEMTEKEKEEAEKRKEKRKRGDRKGRRDWGSGGGR